MITFKPDPDFDSVKVRAQNDVKAWRSAHGEGKGAKWAEWAGDKLHLMMQDRDATVQFLQSPDAGVRLAAVSLVAEYWPANERFASDVLRIAFEDTQPSIRGAALEALTLLRQYIVDPTGILRQLLSDLFTCPSKEVAADILLTTRENELRAQVAFSEMWDKAAGEYATRMLESRSSAESFISHSDPEVRCAAILALDKHWMSKKDLAHICETRLIHDSDTKVRSLAVALLAGCYLHTDDKRVGEVVARLVYDTSNAREFRLHAYLALFTIRGMPVEAFLMAATDAFRFPEDVDWVFVDSFIQEKKRG